jgi:hypothetical protein
MIRIFLSTLFLCGLFLAAQAQSIPLQRLANGKPVTTSVMDITSTHRLTLIVQDGIAPGSGYVYEFGPINAYRIVNGQRTFVKVLKAAEVLNGPVLNVAFGPQRNPDLTGQMEFEIEWIKRYDLNNQVQTLPIPAADRTMRFSVHL